MPYALVAIKTMTSFGTTRWDIMNRSKRALMNTLNQNASIKKSQTKKNNHLIWKSFSSTKHTLEIDDDKLVWWTIPIFQSNRFIFSVILSPYTFVCLSCSLASCVHVSREHSASPHVILRLSLLLSSPISSASSTFRLNKYPSWWIGYVCACSHLPYALHLIQREYFWVFDTLID